MAVILALVPVALISFSLPILIDGALRERDRNVANAVIEGWPLPQSAYRDALGDFSSQLPQDGESMEQRAELLFLAHPEDSASLVRDKQLAIRALIDEPANPRSWTLLCNLAARQGAKAAVDCLDRAFHVAPYDWFTIGQRMSLAAREWPYLDEPLRNAAVGLVVPMWNAPEWGGAKPPRFVLYDLTGTDNGRQLLRAGLIARPETLREFNRWVISWHMRQR